MRRVVALFVIALASVAHAQAKLVPADAAKAAEEKDIEGWNTFLSITSILNLTSNSGVIGQVDGVSTLFSLGLLAGGDYVEGPHLFRSSLAINEGFARTPVIDRFIKSNDSIKIEGLYNYFVTKYWGGYGRLTLQTVFLQSEDVRGQPTTWIDITGATPVVLAMDERRLRLASAFLPFSINESIGVFLDPIRKEYADVTLRLGAAGRHTFADGVLALKDDAMTPEIEVMQLSTVHQFGVEAFAGVTGKFDKDKGNYKAGLAVLLPLVNNDKYDRGAIALTRIALEGNLTYAVTSWLSLVYTLAVTKDPQLFPEGKETVQIQNTLLVTVTLNLVKKAEKKVKTPEEIELEDAKRRADEAEKRANEAEQKLRELQPPPTP